MTFGTWSARSRAGENREVVFDTWDRVGEWGVFNIQEADVAGGARTQVTSVSEHVFCRRANQHASHRLAF
eukprot:4154447-Alexandrium_andersonii.AAC.1